MAHIPALPHVSPGRNRLSDVISPRSDYSPGEVAVLMHTEAYRRELFRFTEVMNSFNPLKAPWKAVALYLWLSEFFLPLLRHSERIKVDVIMPYLDELGYNIPSSLCYYKAAPRFLEDTYQQIERLSFRLYTLAISEDFVVMPAEETATLVQDLHREVLSLFHDLTYHYDEEERCLVYLLSKEGVDFWHRAFCIDEKTGYEKKRYRHRRSTTGMSTDKLSKWKVEEEVKIQQRHLRIGCLLVAAGFPTQQLQVESVSGKSAEAGNLHKPIADVPWCSAEYLSSVTRIFSWYARTFTIPTCIQQYLRYRTIMHSLLASSEGTVASSSSVSVSKELSSGSFKNQMIHQFLKHHRSQPVRNYSFFSFGFCTNISVPAVRFGSEKKGSVYSASHSTEEEGEQHRKKEPQYPKTVTSLSISTSHVSGTAQAGSPHKFPPKHSPKHSPKHANSPPKVIPVISNYEDHTQITNHINSNGNNTNSNQMAIVTTFSTSSKKTVPSPLSPSQAAVSFHLQEESLQNQ
jgi:hypothetical protein